MLSDSERYDLLPQKLQALKQEIGKRVIGQHDVIEKMLIALFSNGNCLFIGVPGLAKTLLVNTVAQSVGLDFGRSIHPDLLPADITGSESYNKTNRRKLSFIKVLYLQNLLLADESTIPPKTQAALLKRCRKKVTAGGKTYILDNPFLVLRHKSIEQKEHIHYQKHNSTVSCSLFLLSNRRRRITGLGYNRCRTAISTICN